MEIDAALRSSLDPQLVHHRSRLVSRQGGDIEGRKDGHGCPSSASSCCGCDCVGLELSATYSPRPLDISASVRAPTSLMRRIVTATGWARQ
jgi:hypothetical protein